MNRSSEVRAEISTPPLQAAISDMSKLILGKDRQVRLALTCLLAGGHLLIEDVPGVGKTTLLKSIFAQNPDAFTFCDPATLDGEGFWDKSKCIISQFPDLPDTAATMELMSSIGLNAVPTWYVFSFFFRIFYFFADFFFCIFVIFEKN